jgi:hypothetical protein
MRKDQLPLPVYVLRQLFNNLNGGLEALKMFDAQVSFLGIKLSFTKRY